MKEQKAEVKLNIGKTHLLRFAFMLIMLAFMVVPVYNQTSEKNVECDTCSVDDGWKVVIRGVTYLDVTLSDFCFDITNKGDTIVMENTLPEDSTISSPILNIYTVHSTLDVYVEDLLIYSYGWDYYNNNELLGYGDHFIDLDDDYAGKKIRIEMTVTEDNAFDGIQAAEIMDGNRFMQQELAGRRINLVVSCFLILFGVIVMLLSMIMMNSAANFEQTYCIAMFSFLVGCWTFCNSDLIAYFISNLRVKVYIEYMTMYVMPLPFTYYFKSSIKKPDTPKWLKIWFWVLIACEVAFAVAAYTCQQLNIIHYPFFLTYCHMLLVASLLFIIVSFIVDFVQAKKANRKPERSAVLVGFGLAMLGVVFELVKFNLSKFFIGFENNKYSSTLCFAVLIIVLAMLVDFGLSTTRNLYKEAEQKTLMHRAYTDELTGIFNRRKCEEMLEEYHDKDVKFAVISLDLNLLKKVNDTQGHDMGDAMLRKFSSCLKHVYGEKGIIGRMGGDEFIVILPKVEAKETEELINRMKEDMFEKNLHDPDIKLSTAFGYAMSDEVPVDADSHAAYRLADERMYVNKRESKMGRT